MLFPDLVDQQRFFTDGSKNKDLPYAGFSVVDGSDFRCEQFRTSNKTSIFSCEAMAIATALNLSGQSIHSEILIFTDSKSVLQATMGGKRAKSKSHLIWEIRDILANLERAGKRVTLFWIRRTLAFRGMREPTQLLRRQL